MDVVINSLTAFFAENTVNAVLKLIGAVLLLIIGLKIIKIVAKTMRKSHGFVKLDPTIQSFTYSLVSIALKVILIISCAALIGIPMTTIVAVLGSAGLALGLALQGGLANIAGSFIILVFKPFKVGDYILAGNNSGTVTDIGIFYTTVTTIDNKVINLPNGELANSAITDYSAMPTRRNDLIFGVSYESDIDKVREVLLSTALACPQVNCDPAPVVLLSAHKDSAIEFTLRYWCNNEDYWTAYYALIENVKRAFDDNNISIPYPQLDVHVNGGKGQ